MPGPRRQIIAIGGAGLAGPADPPLLERYLLAQTRKKNPAVCFLGTATGDADAYLTRFYASFTRLACRPSHVPLFGRTPDLREVLLRQDVIYVGGGNTKSMLAVWRDWGVDALLRRAWQSGVVLAGVSAGAICWFDSGITDSWADRLRVLPCLGLLPHTCCPHYDGEPERRPSLRRLVARGAVRRALALDDGAAAHFAGRRLLRVVTSRPCSSAYDVRRVGSGPVETALAVTRLPVRAR
jgi:peptidase E